MIRKKKDKIKCKENLIQSPKEIAPKVTDLSKVPERMKKITVPKMLTMNITAENATVAATNHPKTHNLTKNSVFSQELQKKQRYKTGKKAPKNPSDLVTTNQSSK